MRPRPDRIHMQYVSICTALLLVIAIIDTVPYAIQIIIQTVICASALWLAYQFFKKNLFIQFILTFFAVCLYDPVIWFGLHSSTPFWIDMIFAFVLFFIALAL